MKKRIFSMLLVVCMVFTLFPTAAFAEETAIGASGVVDSGKSTACQHEHDIDCDYVPAVEGVDCTHLNEDGTYYCAPTDGVSENESTPSEAGYVCDHEDDCGYKEAVAGADCTHTCDLCSKDNPLPSAAKCDCKGEVKCVAANEEKGIEGLINQDCPFCRVEGADLEQCIGKEAQMSFSLGVGAPNDEGKVYFGNTEDGNTPALYRIVAQDEANNTMTLFYNGADITTARKPYDSSGDHNSWSGSTICDWLNNDFLNSTSIFTTAEAEAITKYNSDGTTEPGGYKTITVDQKIVLPSVTEVDDSGTWGWSSGDRTNGNTSWWLRSPGNDVFVAAFVNTHGSVDPDGDYVYNYSGVRPAFKLNLDSVLFASAATGGKSGAASATLSAAEPPTGAQKLTILDKDNLKSGTITATGTDSNKDTVLKVSVEGATPNESLSAIITDSTGKEVKYYGKIGDTGNGAVTDVNLTLPVDLGEENILKIFVEQLNDENITNYASDPVDVTVTVTEPTTPVIAINTQPKKTQTVANNVVPEALTVEASVTPDAQLSYQWFSNINESNTDGELILNATAASYTPEATTTVGPVYYYCVVSATGNAADVPSDVATVITKAASASFTPQTNTATANDEQTLGLIGTSAASSADAVATAATANGKIAITSVSEGTAIITVKNAANNEATIAVTVDATGAITIGKITKYEAPPAGTYRVTYSLTNITTTGLPTVTDGNPLNATLTANVGYTLPDSITVTMGGSAITAGYTYNKGTGAVSISNVTGDVEITAVGVSDSGTTEPVTRVTLNKSTMSLYSNTSPKTDTLVATVAPTNASDKTVSWSSSNNAVATVTNGVVTAVANGTATITATTADGGKTASCTVTVTTYSSGGGSGNGGSGGGGGGGGSSSGNSNSTVTTPDSEKPSTPTKTEIKVDTKVDDKGNATATITEKAITDAFDKALADAKKKGNEANGITLVLNVNTGGKTANSITVNLPKTAQDTIISKKIVNTIVVVGNPNIRVGMDLKAVTEINKQAQADVTIRATKMANGNLTGEAKTAIGSRPVFDLGVSYGNGKSVSNFGNGSVSVSIPYTLQNGEKAGNVYGVYVDVSGKAHWITGSSYDSTAKVLRFATNHFSTYGVGYKTDAPALTDIANHWATTDMEFVVARGLLSGTTATTFSPNTAMTRGMFVTALGRLAGIDTNSYKSGSFTDVKADAYYAPYVNWAASKGITTGTTATTFAPDQAVTRQEMAVFMANYAKAMGYTLPKTRTAVTFADNSSIGSWAADAVKSMQMAGVIMGKDSNRYDPTGTATRAEVSAVLHRYVELVIDTTTAQGWTTNDSGSSLYYQSGKAVTGVQTISGAAYNFNTYGETTQKVTIAGENNPALITDNKKYALYTVKKNEYFYTIAKQYGCSMTELMALNGKKMGDIIYPSDVLKIPQK